jgi:hypothetical protein
MHFSLRQARGLAGAMVLSAGLSLAAVVLPAGASAAQVPASGGAAAHATGKYCVTVIKPLKKGQSSSRGSTHYCSNRTNKATGMPLGFQKASTDVVMVEFWQYTNYRGTWSKLIGPGCTSGSRQWQWSDTQQNGWGFSSWKSYDSCWAVTVYYGLSFGGPKYQYAQGTYEAAQIGSPWTNHVWSVWAGYSR